jgi:hypothetical protein
VVLQKAWSLESAKWAELFRLLSTSENIDFKQVPFISGAQPSIPAESGVYLVVAKPIIHLQGSPIKNPSLKLRELQNVLYVGRSSNLNKRFGEHIKGGPATTSVADITRCFTSLTFWWLAVSGTETQELEDLLIRTFGPPANKVNALQGTWGQPRSAN